MCDPALYSFTTLCSLHLVNTCVPQFNSKHGSQACTWPGPYVCRKVLVLEIHSRRDSFSSLYNVHSRSSSVHDHTPCSAYTKA